MDEATLAERAKVVRAKINFGLYLSITTLTDFQYEESTERDANGVLWAVYTVKFRDPVDTPPAAP